MLREADVSKVTVKPSEHSHSLLELLYHIINWRKFTINRLLKGRAETMLYFEENDWQYINTQDSSLWQKGLEQLEETQQRLVALLQQQDDGLLEEKVGERSYNYRELLYGIVQHDIYHNGQVAYINKLLRAK